jgi:endonuclease/exonuclease/phosphatase (EEP) superfamily protein YafD
MRCAGHLCTASRFPIRSFEYFDRRLLGGYFAAASAAVIDTPGSPVTFVNVHLETSRKGIEPVQHSGLRGWPALKDNLSFRDIESRAITAWIRARSGDSVIIAGDFNQPTDSAIYRRYWTGWTNAFNVAGRGFGYTKFTSWWGIRIDHVLTGRQWEAVRWVVGPNLGSDHRPVLVTLHHR